MEKFLTNENYLTRKTGENREKEREREKLA